MPPHGALSQIACGLLALSRTRLRPPSSVHPPPSSDPPSSILHPAPTAHRPPPSVRPASHRPASCAAWVLIQHDILILTPLSANPATPCTTGTAYCANGSCADAAPPTCGCVCVPQREQQRGHDLAGHFYRYIIPPCCYKNKTAPLQLQWVPQWQAGCVVCRYMCDIYVAAPCGGPLSSYISRVGRRARRGRATRGCREYNFASRFCI
jgi:hypothetical protein